MKAFLMHADRDFDARREPVPNHDALTEDLELATLLGAMAAGDSLLLEVAQRALLDSLIEPDAIAYRQHVLADFLNNPSMARDLYGLAGEALEAQRTVWGSILERDSPRLILRVFLNENDLQVDSVVPLHAGAEWMEREGYDKYAAEPA